MLRSIADESGSNKVGRVDEQEAGVDCTKIMELPPADSS
jgi:hypothetical protein